MQKINSVFELMNSMSQTPSGWAQLQQVFAALPVEAAEFPPWDSPANFFVTMSQFVSGFAEFDYGSPFIYPWPWPMQYACDKMAAASSPQQLLTVLQLLVAQQAKYDLHE